MTRSATCRTLLIGALGIAAIACNDSHEPVPDDAQQPGSAGASRRQHRVDRQRPSVSRRGDQPVDADRVVQRRHDEGRDARRPVDDRRCSSADLLARRVDHYRWTGPDLRERHLREQERVYPGDRDAARHVRDFGPRARAWSGRRAGRHRRRSRDRVVGGGEPGWLVLAGIAARATRHGWVSS